MRDRDREGISRTWLHKVTSGFSLWLSQAKDSISNLYLKSEKGFTLIELLTVIFIIGIITSVITVNLASARKQARDVRRKTDMATIQSAIELFANANTGRVPSAPGSLVSGGSGQCAWIPGLSTYLSCVPSDPIVPNVAPYVYMYQTGAGQYQNNYAITAQLESEPSANVTLPDTTAALTPSNPAFFVTGTFKESSSGPVYYRVSSGAQ